jgi:hypothetical protein
MWPLGSDESLSKRHEPMHASYQGTASQAAEKLADAGTNVEERRFSAA